MSENIRNTLPQLLLFGAELPDEYHRHLIDNIYLWYLRAAIPTRRRGWIASDRRGNAVWRRWQRELPERRPLAIRPSCEYPIVSSGEYQSLQNTQRGVAWQPMDG